MVGGIAEKRGWGKSLEAIIKSNDASLTDFLQGKIKTFRSSFS